MLFTFIKVFPLFYTCLQSHLMVSDNGVQGVIIPTSGRSK